MMEIVVNGFWSYSRAMEDYGGAQVHRAMSACLNESLALKVDIFRDNAENGIQPGRSWPHDLARALGRSLLFSWVQSPRWLSRAACLVEFNAFRDRVRRLAAQAPGIDDEQLWRLLATPIHDFSVDAQQWRQLPNPVRQRFEREWNAMQRNRHLDFAELRSTSGYVLNPGAQCAAAIASVKSDLIEAASHFGCPLAELAGLASQSDIEFERFWGAEFAKFLPNDSQAPASAAAAPDTANLLARQRDAAQMFGQGQTRRNMPLGVALVLLPGHAAANPFWTSASPLGGSRDLLSQIPEPLHPVGNWDGVHLWSADGVRALLPALQRYRLELPDRAIGAALRHALQSDPATVERLGLDCWQGPFWLQDESGELAAYGEKAGDVQLVYVISRTGARHE